MEDKRFEYLYDAGIGDDCISAFISRLDADAISCKMTFEDYMADSDVNDVVKLLKMDAEKFYYLVLFLYDYTCDVCFNGIAVEEGGHEMMWMLIDRGRMLINGERPRPLKTDASCSFKIQGRTYKVADIDSIAILLYWIHRGMIQMSPKDNIWELNWLIDDYEQHEIHRNESVSVAIWCFASLLLQFFKNNPRFSGRAPKGSGISLNKQLLASRIIYRLGLSRNESFLYSDETLKGFMRQYKGRELPKKERFTANLKGIVDDYITTLLIMANSP